MIGVLSLIKVSSEYLEKALATSDVRSKPETLGQVLTVIGWNNLKMKNFKAARKSFERCLKEVPAQGTRRSEACGRPEPVNGVRGSYAAGVTTQASSLDQPYGTMLPIIDK